MITASSPLATRCSLSDPVISKALIIPAAGSGKRMQREVPKPFIELVGQPILAHTISRFLKLEGLNQIIVATSSQSISRTEGILQELIGDEISWSCVQGGTERQYSIQNALQAVADAPLVLVHDAVRPFVSLKSIKACCEAAEKAGAAVLGTPVKDTIKKTDEEHFVEDTPDRRYLWQIQTPQVFKTDILQKAYRHADEQNYFGTDDASLVEWMGEPVQVVQGDRHNFKITYPQDLEYARALVKKGNVDDE